MSQHLLIQWLDTSPPQANISLWQADGQVSWQQWAQPISSLATLINTALAKPNASASLPTTVLVPGEWVSISQVNLPKRIPKKNLKQVIGYALEDELLEDPAKLHFVLIDEPARLRQQDKKTKTNNQRKVAVISKLKLATLVEQLRQQNIEASYIIPDFLALPMVNDIINACPASATTSAEDSTTKDDDDPTTSTVNNVTNTYGVSATAASTADDPASTSTADDGNNKATPIHSDTSARQKNPVPAPAPAPAPAMIDIHHLKTKDKRTPADNTTAADDATKPDKTSTTAASDTRHDSKNKATAAHSDDSAWQACIIDQHAILRTEALQGYAIDAAQLPWLCQQMLSRYQAETKHSLNGLKLKLHCTEASLPWDWPATLSESLSLESTCSATLQQCFDFLQITQPNMNLLTGEFRSKKAPKKTSTKKSAKGSPARLWRRCLYLFYALIACSFASRAAHYLILNKQNEVFLQQAISQATAQAPVEMRSQLQNLRSLAPLQQKLSQLLEQLKQFSEHNLGLQQLNFLNGFFSRHTKSQLMSFDYNGKTWQAIITINSLKTLNQITAALSNQRWTVSQSLQSESANNQANLQNLSPELQQQARALLAPNNQAAASAVSAKKLVAILTLTPPS